MDDFTRHYLIAMLWSTTDDDQNPLDDRFGVEDIASEAIASASADCAAFRERASADLESIGATDEQNGHDFWLTRNGHGCGFWDRGYGAAGDRLSEVAQSFGELWPYVGDDGLVYLG